jgi:hypothetical protein
MTGSPGSDGRQARATIAARGQRRVERPTPQSTALPPEHTQRAFPLRALLAGVGLGLVCVLTTALALARNPRDIAALEEDGAIGVDGGAASGASSGAADGPSAQPAGPARLTAAELDAARLGGVESLRALAQRYPEEPTVILALSLALREKQDYAGSLRALRHLLEIAPERHAEKDVQQALIEISNGPADTAAEAFDLLKTKMEATGPDILFELVQNATGKYAREHAASALAEPAVQKLASRQLLLADELRRSLPCARKAIVPRAAVEADGRSLPYLRALTPAKSCRGGGLANLLRGGGGECASYACITPNDRALIAGAIDAIEKRDKR